MVTVQLGPPVKLAPRKLRPLPPPERRPPQPEPLVEQGPPPPRGASVEVDPLQAIDPDSVGLIDETQGGFGVDIWNGTDRALVERLLPLAPVATRSRASRDMLRRLLLSRATAPHGKRGKKTLIAIRVERLLAMGEVDSAIRLIRLAPIRVRNESMLRTEVESLFYRNDNPGACTRVRKLINDHKGTYWQQAMAFCLALSEEHVRSAMIADILRERNETGQAFFTLVDALAGDDGAVVETLQNPGGLLLAMMRAASLKLPADVLASSQPAVLRAVALSPNVDLEVRIEAAEQAEKIGALSLDRLSEIYASVPFDRSEIDSPLEAAEANWGPRARALLIRAAVNLAEPTAKAELLRNAWQLSREKGGLDVLLRASLPTLRSIKPAGELMWFAEDAARALFATGNSAEAMAWYAAAREQAGSNAEAKKAAVSLWPLAQLAAEAGESWDPAPLGRWLKSRKDDAPEAALRRARLLFSLFESLGQKVGPQLWMSLLGEAKFVMSAVPDAALWHGLRDASANGRVGETILLSLLALAGEGSAGGTPLTLGAVIGALHRVGLESEARGLAVEAAVAAGV